MRVTDAATQKPICDAAVRATDGAYSEALVMTGSDGCAYAGAWERPGTYRITVTAPGYDSAAIHGVVVTAGECHVEPQQREVELSPQ